MRRMTRWPSMPPGMSTPGTMRAPASGWCRRPPSPPQAPTRRTRCSPPAGTRSTGIRRSTRSPTTSRTCDQGAAGGPAAGPPRGKADMANQETAYQALDHDHGGDGQWAFGTGFDEPLAGVDTTVPDGISPADLGVYCLMLGDDALVLAQRLTEWVTSSPELEEEVAVANVALDLLGQARLLLARAG